ncbi:hypothetical protein O6H91_10G047200 [Diphasiastrum complanatum]|uniref:Uncharacterized protein n=1 Tax=Diphasiastrum complanatum TaxID=34168 RepID=A0ACC2CGF1_DIPCM|nr:hypothetical protein O6H91_10G047200 [Diphasiastrum complanatum]
MGMYCLFSLISRRRKGDIVFIFSLSSVCFRLLSFITSQTRTQTQTHTDSDGGFSFGWRAFSLRSSGFESTPKTMIQSADELQRNLDTCLEQLQQVRAALALEPGNVEYQEMAKGLEEVIELTRELLVSSKQAEASLLIRKAHGFHVDEPAYPEFPHTNVHEDLDPTWDVIGRLPVGTKVQAIWSEDGEWYNATIEAITPLGYLVVYDEWGNKEEVDPSSIRRLKELEDADAEEDALLDAEREAEATRQAIKRKIALAAEVDVMPRDLPFKLRIQPDDPEDVKTAKRKKIHAFKSKLRFEQLELTQNKRQNAWQQFQTSKGRSKKVGFFTGRKRESIFKSPDDPKGKVGVTGSGKGTTDFQKREKHLHLKIGAEDDED